MARPKKKKPKNMVVRVRLTEYEYNKALARAKTYNDGNLSGFIRECIVGGVPKFKRGK